MTRKCLRFLFSFSQEEAAGVTDNRAIMPDTPLRFKAEFLAQLVRAVPTHLARQDKTTGQFGTGVWIVTEQNDIYPLAAAWSLNDPANPHYHRSEVLEAVVKGGDALIAAQDPRGMWVFRKKDNSTWGDIFMPWTYSRWIRAYGLVRDGMTPEQRTRWEKALTLGFSGIAKQELQRIHNIPAHHAMGLYIAGIVLDRPEWKAQASEFMQKVVAAQDAAGGFWSENLGPVVGYNLVYTDALGVYYALSRDRRVLPALERAARFHANFTYPDGSSVETVDERQVYHANVTMPNVGFTFSDEGRGYIRQQWARLTERAKGKPMLSAETAASYLLYGEEGDASPTPGEKDSHRFVLGNGDALVQRKKPWFVALSAYHAPVPKSRWIQDRQNLVSVFHDRVGLIVGGGNTKLQPLWSTFTVGDTSRLSHRPGDENPDFMPPPGLFHVPTEARLEAGDAPALSLVYGPARCRVQVIPIADDTIRLVYSLVGPTPDSPVAAHIPLLPDMGKVWRTASGKSGKLDEIPIRLDTEESGGWFEQGGWRITLPPSASLTWPVLPHDPYKKDGSATAGSGRLVLSLPLSAEQREQETLITIP
jgi:hypothetical protein